jgi:hypothetical protein
MAAKYVAAKRVAAMADLAETFPIPTSSELLKQSKKKPCRQPTKSAHLLLRVRDAFVATNFRLLTSDFSLRLVMLLIVPSRASRAA